jgi:hypothetical protein
MERVAHASLAVQLDELRYDYFLKSQVFVALWPAFQNIRFNDYPYYHEKQFPKFRRRHWPNLFYSSLGFTRCDCGGDQLRRDLLFRALFSSRDFWHLGDILQYRGESVMHDGWFDAVAQAPP